MKLKNNILGGRSFGRPAIAVILLAGFVQLSHSVAAPIPGSFPGKWSTLGRAVTESSPDGLVITNGMAVSEQSWKDCEFSFRARTPAAGQQVQIWSAIRVKSRNSFYAIGYRGGRESQLSLARYAPDGQSKFLGWVPLDPEPKPGTWVDFRILVSGKHFQVYLNDETLPRINIEDQDALWQEGGVGLGGGWLATEFAVPKIEELSGSKLQAFQKVGDQVWAPPVVDKAKLRAEQRAAYQPAKIVALPEVRGEISLDGNWLFMPDHEFAGESSQEAPATNTADESWHVLPVPAFWTPTLGWLHGEEGLPGLKGQAASKGPSDTLVAGEYARVEALTFDWKKTKGGWYRHHLDLPADLKGKQYELVFDAIAKISEVWVNGEKAGSNVGMFRQGKYDVSKLLKPGANVIAVHAIGNPDRTIKDANKVASVAVTVEVTNEMINSLPHGMTDNNSGGIWQPVSLVVTDPLRVGEIFIQPTLEDAKMQIQVLNGAAGDNSAELSYRILDHKDQSVLYASTKAEIVQVPAGTSTNLSIATPKLQPKLWSPSAPNLYDLELTLTAKGAVMDKQVTTFGFRTFTIADGKLMLNGKPYWLRGGNHFPVTLRPNDGKLARRFIALAKEGNVAVTRSHAVPFTRTWFEASDELGMGVSYEGTWPWLMIKGEPPDPALLKVWKEEFISLMKQYRNHPSLLFWTVNNEMNFASFDQKDPELLKRKWVILDDAIKAMRETDPTRPISAYSGYRRGESKKGFEEVVDPNKFDDGDIDDAHHYFGWYNESFFHLYKGEYGNKGSYPGRPLISQEMSTGYPRNDGWPSRSYQFPRYVPQALVGNYSFEQSDPMIFLKRQSFMTKELAEVIRRTNRDNASGILHFAYLTWFTDVWDADKVKPMLTAEEFKLAMTPVLVSAELFGRHFYAGDTIKHRVCLANDSEDFSDLPAGNLTWKIISAGNQVLAQGSKPTLPLPYYSNAWVDVEAALPSSLAGGRVNAVLSYELEAGGKVISKNQYDVVIATRDWAIGKAKNVQGQLFDPQGMSKEVTEGLGLTTVTSTDRLNPSQLLVVGDLAELLKKPNGDTQFRKFVEDGGRALILQGGADLTKLFPDQVKSFRKAVGEIATMEVPESPIFEGIEPLDTAFFEMGEGKLPFVSTGTFEVDRAQPGVTTLANECRFHPDIKPGDFFKNAGASLIEIKLGKGTVVASELMLSAKERDPVAGKLLSNLLGYLGQAPSPF